MANLYAVTGETLTGIADAIKLKSGNDTPMSVADMPMRIGMIDAPRHTEWVIPPEQQKTLHFTGAPEDWAYLYLTISNNYDFSKGKATLAVFGYRIGNTIYGVTQMTNTNGTSNAATGNYSVNITSDGYGITIPCATDDYPFAAGVDYKLTII